MNRKIILQRAVALLMLIALFTPVGAEVVSKLIYNGQPEDLNETTVEVPHGIVAMTERVQVGIPGSLTEGNPTGGEPSIFFVLDNSGSMWLSGHDMDDNAYRYKVTTALIDSIKARNPQAEIGLGIFGSDLYMKESDDPELFDVVNSGDDWGYVPLLNLSQEYTSEQAGTGTGDKILKHYLETRTTTTANPLSYRPSGAKTGTNITRGFDGAVSAFKKAANPANRHYVIFISDGDATVPADTASGATEAENKAERERFMQGTGVPTTFTIFFSKKDPDTDTLIIPQSIPTMTNNINSNNGNQDSKYWAYQNNSEDELMRFLMDNVISVIDQKIAAEVKKVTINGTSGSTWDGTTTTVSFTDLFPLTGITTPFDYNIDYYVEDTVIIDGVQDITLIDTTLNTKFDVTLKDNLTDLPEKFTKESWERSLGFFDGNQALTVVSASSQNTEIRFTEEAREMFYGYSDVDVEIRSKMKGDVETLRLNKNSNIFSRGIDIDNSGAVATDGRIQVDMVDTLIATFRNPKLPLDTIQIEVPYDVGTLLTLGSATYYDNSGDGFIDSVFIGFQIENALSVDEVEELFSLLTIAPDRKFSFLSREWVNNGLGMKVVENSAAPQTAVVAGDTVSLRETILASGGLTYKSQVTVTDSVAPVILKDGAMYNDLPGKNDDKLIIQFSEDIRNNTNTGQYFSFRRGADTYTASLTPESFNGNVGTFLVTSLSTEFMAEGDTLRIQPEYGMVTDLAGVTQKNPKNVERRLQVVSTISMGDVIFYDTSADGYIDLVTIEVIAGEGAEINADDLKSQILLPANRRLSIESASMTGTTLSLVVDGTNSNINTAIADDDSVTILAGKVGTTNIPANITKKAKDGMAPVIMPGGAVLRDLPGGTNDDTLTITYSEPVLESGQSGRYLSFRRGAAPYTVYLTPLETTGSQVRYSINQLLDVTSMQAGDSLRIADAFNLVSDYVANIQKNPANVERELQILTTIGVSNATYFDNSGDGFIDSITLSIDAGEGATLDAAALQGQIKLPDHRFITINSSKLNGTEFQMLVTETGTLPVTEVTDQDKITLLAGNIGSAKIDNNITVAVIDSMAPVIIKEGAVLYDYPQGEDTLEVTFSEPVEKGSRTGKYFSFRSGNSPYDVFLTPTETSGNMVRFVVNNAVTDYMRDGDSLRVNSAEALIKDIANGVMQRNENNSEERLRVVSTIDVGEAKYFDANADGFIDSITIAIQAGDGVTLSGNDLIGQIELPAYRNFNVISAVMGEGELSIIVTENRQVPNTAVSNSDSITIAQGTIKNAMIPATRVIGAQDFMAPVILQGGAVLVDYPGAADSLVVTFSEPVEVSASGELFDIRRGAEAYKLFLEPVAVAGEEVVFAVSFVNMETVTTAPSHMTTGDSLRIKADRPLIKDLLGKSQTNPLNIERRLQVIADITPIEAAYFDANADGLIDSIRITLEAGEALYDGNSTALANALKFNDERNFTLNSSKFEGTTLVVNVTEDNEVPNTAVTPEDRINVNSGSINGGMISMEKSIAVLDSAAPVIMPLGAVLHDSLSGTDLLTVEFSEPVTVTSVAEKSLLFDAGDLTLTLTEGDVTKFTFAVEGTYNSTGDDSVWINHAVANAIVDLNGLNQGNDKNIRRPIQVITYINPYDLVVNAITPYRQGIDTVPATFNLPEFDLYRGENGGVTGLAMQARAILTGSDMPLDGVMLEGEVTVIDPLGNTIVPTTPMVFDNQLDHLIFVWNGRNQAGRKVANGAYAARFTIRAKTADGSYNKEYGKTVTLGVQDRVPGTK